MLGKVGKYLRIAGPVLVKLRRELDKIAGSVGARQAWVLLIGKHAMQRMAKLVEHGDHVIIGQ
ncbi:hypothetical protein D3C80_1736680 [compost metagenome]